MNKDGIPLPSALSGEVIERLIRLDKSLIFLVTGALAEIVEDWWLEQTGTLTESDAKQALDDMLWCFMKGCDVTPVGTIQMFAGATIPDRWIFCEGQSLLRSAYVALFAEIGTLYGAADGTHFNLPDMRYRSPMHPGDSADTLDTLGLAGQLGENRHALTTAELPAHFHSITDPGHTHPPVAPSTVFVGRHSGGGTDWVRATAGATFDQSTATGSRTTGITINNSGGGGLHNNLHPVLGINFMIYAGI